MTDVRKAREAAEEEALALLRKFDPTRHDAAKLVLDVLRVGYRAALATAPAGEPQNEVEFDRLLMRLLIIKDWLLRGGKAIGEDTRLAAAGDIELAHNLIVHLHQRQFAQPADGEVAALTKRLNNLSEHAEIATPEEVREAINDAIAALVYASLPAPSVAALTKRLRVSARWHSQRGKEKRLDPMEHHKAQDYDDESAMLFAAAAALARLSAPVPAREWADFIKRIYESKRTDGEQ